jgi:ribonuclease G
MKELVINVSPLETRIALIEEGRLAELNIEREESRSVVGNIYKGRVDGIVPGIQAAFIDIGLGKNGFLYVSDIAGAEGTGDFSFEEGAAKPGSLSRKGKAPSIESMLKKGQTIMVQVVKDTLGTKGVRLTNFVTLPGRYVVLMPTVSTLGVSRKIESEKERDKIKKILQSVRPQGAGLICRTAAEGKSKSDIQNDAKYLARVWDDLKTSMETKQAPCVLHDDIGPILRAIRDTFTNEISKLTIDSEDEYERILSFLDGFAPNLKKRCKFHNVKKPLFEKYNLEKEIDKAMQRTVHLKSGGYICIDQTEALVAIDVNTGRFTGKKQLEDTVFHTNLEAAVEIAHQVRLRDMGGIIVCDFIDMKHDRNRKELIRKLQEALKNDRAKTTISEVSELGMIEMTRKRVKHNLIKALSQVCPYCNGGGMVRSVTTMTCDILRRLESLFYVNKEKKIILQVHPDVARRLRNENKKLLDSIANGSQREIAIESVSDFHIHDVKILSSRTREEIVAAPEKH